MQRADGAGLRLIESVIEFSRQREQLLFVRTGSQHPRLEGDQRVVQQSQPSDEVGDGDHAHQHHDVVQLVENGDLGFRNSRMWTDLSFGVRLTEVTAQRVGHRQQSERA